MKPTTAVISLLVLTGGCADTQTLELSTQASGSAYFSLSRPYAYKSADGFQLSGRVCRRGRTTVLSPPRVRIEHVGADGVVSQVTSARVGPIYRASDQACSTYVRRVDWTMAGGDTVRACFDRGKACPSDAPAKAITVAPPTPGPTSNR